MKMLSNDFTRRMLAGHSLLGLIFGTALYMICLSGTLIVLVDQLSRWERPDAPRIDRVDDTQLAAISRSVYARARASHVEHDIFINIPTADYPRMTVFAGAEGGRHQEWSVDAAGRVGDEIALPWVEFVQTLHFNLTVPGALGRYLVGIFGTVLLASIGTGILAHRRIFKDAFRLRWGGSRRLGNADLHNRIGVWALPFHLIVSLTGSLLGLSGLIIFVLAMVAYRGDQGKAIASLLGPQPTADARPAPLPDIMPMLARIETRQPGADVTQLSFHNTGTKGQLVQIATAAPGRLARNETWSFSGDGRLLGKAGYTDGNLGMRVFGMITPLHYGTYGGVALKLIYFVLGLGLTIIIASGGNIWLARRREQGRPAPRLERLWTGLVWGQPLVLLVMALIAMASSALTPAYWLLTAVIWLVSLRLEIGQLAFSLKAATGATMLLLAAAHLWMHGTGDFVAVAIDGALAATGLCVLWTAMGVTRRKAMEVSAEAGSASQA